MTPSSQNNVYIGR